MSCRYFLTDRTVWSPERKRVYMDIHKEMKEIAEYIENLQFRKKTFGGCDEEDVLQKIGGICKMYEAVISRLEKEYGEKSSELIGSMSQIRDYREHTLAKARNEAEAILQTAQKDVKAEEEKLEKLRSIYSRQTEQIRRENEAYCEKVRNIIRQIEAVDHDEKQS